MPQSLQCPRCNGSVSIADDAAGKRVKCPHCQQNFLAPGIAVVANDDDNDDDWLQLDGEKGATTLGHADPSVSVTPQAPLGSEPLGSAPIKDSSESLPNPTAPREEGSSFFGDSSLPEPIVPESPSAGPPTPASGSPNPPSTSGPTLSEKEKALLGEFTDVDNFTHDSELPPAQGGGNTNTLDAIRSLGSSAPTPGGPTSGDLTSGAPTANSVEYETEFRVTCNICGSILYAKAVDTGKTIKCSDCHSPITIPRPPKVRKKSTINLKDAETFALEKSETGERRADPFQRSADELLDEASRQEDAEEEPDYDTPSVKEWLRSVFGVFLDPGVLVHWAGLSALAAIPAVIAFRFDSTILIMGLFPAGFILGLLTVSCGFAILQSVANEEDSVAEWPTLDPFAWLGQLFVACAAAGLAAIPVWALCTLAMGPHLFSVAITMFSVYLLFPFILLSMLDMNSPFVPFSPEVARSVTKCEEAWGGFYFSSGIVFIGLFLVFAMASTFSPAAGAVISIICGVGATFAYFGMLGRLAYSIGQAVNAPPMENDIDRTKKSSPT
ncbi:MAG: hypothetical protein ACR2NZ_00365 [Rubripirellula sp.]